MSVKRQLLIDVELESVGQRDQTERWNGKLEVTRQPDGRVRIGKQTQSGFQALSFEFNDLNEALAATPGETDA